MGRRPNLMTPFCPDYVMYVLVFKVYFYAMAASGDFVFTCPSSCPDVWPLVPVTVTVTVLLPVPYKRRLPRNIGSPPARWPRWPNIGCRPASRTVGQPRGP